MRKPRCRVEVGWDAGLQLWKEKMAEGRLLNLDRPAVPPESLRRAPINVLKHLYGSWSRSKDRPWKKNDGGIHRNAASLMVVHYCFSFNPRLPIAFQEGVSWHQRSWSLLTTSALISERTSAHLHHNHFKRFVLTQIEINGAFKCENGWSFTFHS